jgi:hypothetical protein
VRKTSYRSIIRITVLVFQFRQVTFFSVTAQSSGEIITTEQEETQVIEVIEDTSEVTDNTLVSENNEENDSVIEVAENINALQDIETLNTQENNTLPLDTADSQDISEDEEITEPTTQEIEPELQEDETSTLLEIINPSLEEVENTQTTTET